MRRNLSETWQDHKILLVSVFFLFAFLVAFFWNRIFIIIHAGEAGAFWRLFGGTVTSKSSGGPLVFDEGLHIVAPWNQVYVYNARVQQVADNFTVLSRDGLAIKVEVSIRYRPIRELLGDLHKNFGFDYVEKMVVPQVQADIRTIMGQYKPEEIYASQGFINQMIEQDAMADLRSRYIELDGLVLKSVMLPVPVAQSIESKLRAKQLAEEFDYRIMTEQKEKERKLIEAEGIKQFQDIVSENGVNFEQFLRFKGIEATLELARSPNAKVVIIGGGSDRLPIILDSRSDQTAPPAAALPPPVSGGARK